MSEFVLFGIIALLGAALATCLAVIMVGRVVRRVLDERRQVRERRLRPQLLALLAAEEDAPAELELHRGDLDALADLAGPLLRKVRGDARERLAAQLHDRGVVTQARQRLGSANAVRRARAAAFLGNVGDDDAIGPLSEALHDRHPDVRATAARALGRIGRPEGAPALLGALGGQPWERDVVPAGTIVTSLLAIGPAAAPAALTAALSARADRRAMAIETLGLLGSVPATDALIGLLAIDPRGMEVRIRAARALGRIGSPRAVPFLAAILRSDEPWPLRAVAAKAVGDIGAAGAVDALGALLTDPEPAVVVNVARALATTPEGRALLAPLAADAPPAGIIPEADWSLHQPSVAAAEALAAVGERVAAGPPPRSSRVVDLRADGTVPDAPGELTVRSPSAAEGPT